MAMSRRKQPHPRSKKDCDDTMFVLPDELKCDEESHDIIARSDIHPGHRFGPFPAISLVSQSTRLSSDSDMLNSTSTTSVESIDQSTTDQHQQRSFQLLDVKYNWLARCSISASSHCNLNVIIEDEHIFLIATESIPSGGKVSTSTMIHAKLNSNEDSQSKSENRTNSSITTTDFVQVKSEPVECEDLSSSSLSSSNSQMNSNNKSKSPPPSPTSNSKTKDNKKNHPLVFTCDDCGIRFSSRSTLDAHRQYYCTKRETVPPLLITGASTKNQSTDATVPSKMRNPKRKYIDNNDSAVTSNKRLFLPSVDTYCNECDIVFSKAENLIQHKLHYCGMKSSNNHISTSPLTSATSNRQQQMVEQNLANGFRPPIPFDRPIQIGQFIYVPVPIVSPVVDPTSHSSMMDTDGENQTNKPLDLSKPKKHNEESDTNPSKSSSPLDLTVEKTINPISFIHGVTIKTNNLVLPQIYECEYCSIRFSSLKTLHAHQENYCGEYRKQKKMLTVNSLSSLTTNESKSSNVENNTSKSPSLSACNILSKSLSISPNEISSISPLPVHRTSPFMCRLCKYRGNTLRGMRMHFKFHLSNNEPCSDDDIIMTSSVNQTANLCSSAMAVSQLLLKCTICSAMFDHEEALFNHMRCVHTKESLLECLECQSRFCSKWNLLRHMKLTHTNIKCDDDDEEEEEEEIEIDDNEDRSKVVDDQNEDQDESKNINRSPTINSNRSSPKDSVNEDQDLVKRKDELSDPVNLTRQVLIESMDMNSSKNLLNPVGLKKKFACPFCYIKFGSIDTLKQHMTNYCSSRPANEDQTKPTNKVSLNSSTNDNFCSSCQIPFRHKSSYEAHKMYYCRSSQKSHVKIQA